MGIMVVIYTAVACFGYACLGDATPYNILTGRRCASMLHGGLQGPMPLGTVHLVTTTSVSPALQGRTATVGSRRRCRAGSSAWPMWLCSSARCQPIRSTGGHAKVFCNAHYRLMRSNRLAESSASLEQ